MGLWKPRDRATVGHSEYTQYDLPLLSTAGVLLEAGNEATFIDGQAERLDETQLIDRVRDTHPDFVVGMVQFVSLDHDLSILTSLKRAIPEMTLIIVGSTVKIAIDKVLSTEGVDYAVQGEPEIPTRDLIQRLESGQLVADIPGVSYVVEGKQVVNPARTANLREFPPVPYHLLSPYRYINEHYWTGEKLGLVVSSRGCPYSCAYYCPYPLAYGSKLLFRDPKIFVDEIEFLNKEYGVRHFHFRDQVFTAKERHVLEICDEIIHRGLEISWLCETRFNLIHSDEMLKKMRRAGCAQVHFGLESGDEALFLTIGKPGTTLEEARSSFTRVRNAGMDVHAHLIIGLPGESWSSIRETVSFIQSLYLVNINLCICIPYPGTEMHNVGRRNNWIETDDYSVYSQQFVMRTEDLTTTELTLAFRYMKDFFEETGIKGKIRHRLLRFIVETGRGKALADYLDHASPGKRRFVERILRVSIPRYSVSN